MKTSEILTCLGKGLLVGAGIACAFNGVQDLIIDIIRYTNPDEFGYSARDDFITSMTTFLATTAVAGGAASIKFLVTKKFGHPTPNGEDAFVELMGTNTYNTF